MSTDTKPERVFKQGGVYASVFFNQGKNWPYFSVSLRRRFQKDCAWHTSDHFTYPRDLQHVATVVQSALDYCRQNEERVQRVTAKA